MRPRNVLTQTNNMRKLMGLPLLNEDTGETAEDVKKKVLTEDRSFSLGFANAGGLTLTENSESEEDYKRYLNQVANKIEIKGGGSDYKNAKGETITIYNFDYAAATKLADEGVIDQSIFNHLTKLYKATQEITETTEAEETEEEGDGEEVNDVVEEQEDEFGDGPLGVETGIDVGTPQPGDGEGGLGLSTDAQVFAEGSFSKYNITLED